MKMKRDKSGTGRYVSGGYGVLMGQRRTEGSPKRLHVWLPGFRMTFMWGGRNGTAVEEVPNEDV